MFVAGALGLPTSGAEEKDSLVAIFDQDGRWALLCMSCYAAISLWANWYLFGLSPIGLFGATAVIFVLLPLAYQLIKNRKDQGAVTSIHLALSLWGATASSPASY